MIFKIIKIIKITQGIIIISDHKIKIIEDYQDKIKITQGIAEQCLTLC